MHDLKTAHFGKGEERGKDVGHMRANAGVPLLLSRPHGFHMPGKKDGFLEVNIVRLSVENKHSTVLHNPTYFCDRPQAASMCRCTREA